MLLQEEYLNRHDIADVPIINYVNKGSLLFKTGFSWILSTIDWVIDDKRPGKYNINYYMPVHDGYFDGKYFKKLNEMSAKVEWDEYGQFILNWTKNWTVTGLKPVKTHKELVLTSWEIFLYCCDSFLAEFADLLDQFYCSLNVEITLEERYAAYEVAIAKISAEYPVFYSVYINDFMSKFDNYSYWLINIIDNIPSTKSVASFG